jgi:hypothetical protein
MEAARLKAMHQARVKVTGQFCSNKQPKGRRTITNEDHYALAGEALRRAEQKSPPCSWGEKRQDALLAIAHALMSHIYVTEQGLDAICVELVRGRD